MPDQYVRAPKAAEMLGITRQAVYRLIQRGTLTCIRPYPRQVLVPVAEIEARRASH